MSGEGSPGYAGIQGESARARRASSQCFSGPSRCRSSHANAWPAPSGEEAPFKASGLRCSVCHQNSVAGKATLISCCCVISSSSGRNTESRRRAAPAAAFSGASPLLRDPHCRHYPRRRPPRQTAEISVQYALLLSQSPRVLPGSFFPEPDSGRSRSVTRGAGSPGWERIPFPRSSSSLAGHSTGSAGSKTCL